MSVPCDRYIFIFQGITVFTLYIGLDQERKGEILTKRLHKVAKELNVEPKEILIKKESV